MCGCTSGMGTKPGGARSTRPGCRRCCRCSTCPRSTESSCTTPCGRATGRHSRTCSSRCISIWSGNRGNGFTMATSESGQLRPGLWETVNELYPGSMITTPDVVPLASMAKPLSEARLVFVSTAGVQPKGTMPFDVVHPVGDYSFRRVPSTSKISDLEIHQIKYPTSGALRDLNVIFPIERLQELAGEGVIGDLTPNFFSFI